LDDVTPADVLHGRREQILQRRKEVRAQTIEHRKDYNQTLRELLRPSDETKVFGSKSGMHPVLTGGLYKL
jgi:hypothetical protein